MLDRDEALHLLEYDRWANTRLGQTLAARREPLPEAERLFAHVVAASELWLVRVEGGDYAPLPVWPAEVRPGDALERFTRLSTRWSERMRAATPAELARRVTFQNSKGEACSDPLEAIVRHLVHHGTHHRGHIASLLRASGATPENLDYIVWRRACAKEASASRGGAAPTSSAWKHFVIESTYLVPLEKLDTLLAAHRAHLGTAFERGLLLASGPQEPRTGGVILARAKDRAEIDALLAADPFQRAGFSRYRVTEFVPVKTSESFAAWTTHA
ncbi:MAG: DinB family protein [Planctomycetes bacterium]|nr:DinB family protein [Planctomycetota bacterium]